MPRCTTVILGGGRGSRLAPLTALRAKPAVPLAGKYRLIDIPISNSINSRLLRIYVLTQFRSNSLNVHVADTYRFDMFSRGSVEVLAAEQTEKPEEDWFQGTADALRKSMHHLASRGAPDEVLILSGDHLYRMDYRELLRTHRAQGAQVTVSCLPVTREDCAGFGVMALDARGRVVDFVEKPGPEVDLERFALPPEQALGDRRYMASMGVYVFDWGTLDHAMQDESLIDFGKDILPQLIGSGHVAGHLFDGYWEDIGTVRSFFESNLELTRQRPPFQFFHPEAPIYTRPRFLPPSTFRGTQVVNSIISDGCILEAEHIERSVVGVRARVRAGCTLKDSILMGADYFEHARRREKNRALGLDGMGVGEGSVLERVIVDKNARIGAGCVLRGDASAPDEHHEQWSRVDGVLVVRKNAIIPPGTRIG